MTVTSHPTSHSLKPQGKGIEGSDLFWVTSRPLGPHRTGLGTTHWTAVQGCPRMQGYAPHIGWDESSPYFPPCPLSPFCSVILGLNNKNSSVQEETAGFPSIGWNGPVKARPVEAHVSTAACHLGWSPDPILTCPDGGPLSRGCSEPAPMWTRRREQGTRHNTGGENQHF